jgi:hypothetical protein
MIKFSSVISAKAQDPEGSAKRLNSGSPHRGAGMTGMRNFLYSMTALEAFVVTASAVIGVPNG